MRPSGRFSGTERKSQRPKGHRAQALFLLTQPLHPNTYEFNHLNEPCANTDFHKSVFFRMNAVKRIQSHLVFLTVLLSRFHFYFPCYFPQISFIRINSFPFKNPNAGLLPACASVHIKDQRLAARPASSSSRSRHVHAFHLPRSTVAAEMLSRKLDSAASLWPIEHALLCAISFVFSFILC